MNQKVFCIGSHKTATSSIAKALAMLDYNVCRRIKMLENGMTESNVIDSLKSRKLQPIFNAIGDYNAFVDNPWSLVYKEVDQQFPGSKFILTIRDEKEWLQSVLNYFKGYETDIRKYIYGDPSPQGNEELYLATYRKHNRDVIEYFKNRPNDLLIVEVEKNMSWDTICTFLGKEIPSSIFPHENKTKNKTLEALESAPRKKLNFERLVSFNNMKTTTKVLFLETFFLLTLSRLFIYFLPFKSVAKFLGKIMTESEETIPKNQSKEVIKIGRTIMKASRYTPFRSLCFEQALTAKFMLNRRRIPSTIYFGVAKDGPKVLKAHAWTRAGDFVLTGNKGKSLFTVVSTFT